ncbi:FAD-dependent oxidoreductase [Ideonella sp. A 288]|uniref:flavin monoamine oxidase family protein n=1 Tax=Ideonella sp. A 288 TaxID=1962181 RepID=UPI001F237C4D|nr:FAD-dependent oxidoreductase [Ideonella sp. A 288]
MSTATPKLVRVERPPAMPEVAIVGGGVCGLALAHSLQARQVDWALFEARDRLGGRVLTQASQRGLALDLGPSWFWPDTQPSMARLVEDLDLAWVDQPDDGRVLWLDDPHGAPRVMAVDGMGRAVEGGPARPGALHGGARRLSGGMRGLVDALASPLPAARLHRGWALQRVLDGGDHVALHLQGAGGSGDTRLVQARRVVLALPPRVADATVDFQPGLPRPVVDALRATPTWMATAAKAAVAYGRPFWRDIGHTGNACVVHPQAVLAEVFDVGPVLGPSPAQGVAGAALGGFLALGVASRRAMKASLPMLIDSQLGMLFGPDASDGELHLQDWADERWTCSPMDLADAARAGAHPVYGHAGLTEPLWGGRLLFGGSETAARGGGYLEGALNAAARLRRQLTAPLPAPGLGTSAH